MKPGMWHAVKLREIQRDGLSEKDSYGATPLPSSFRRLDAYGPTPPTVVVPPFKCLGLLLPPSSSNLDLGNECEDVAGSGDAPAAVVHLKLQERMRGAPAAVVHPR